MARVVGKYFDRAIEAHVIICRERHLFLAKPSARIGRPLLQPTAKEVRTAADTGAGESERGGEALMPLDRANRAS